MQHEHTNNGYLDAKVDGIDTRLTDHMKNVNLRFDGVDRRFDELREDNHKDNEDIKERISTVSQDFATAIERVLSNYATKEKVGELERRVGAVETQSQQNHDKITKWAGGLGLLMVGIGIASTLAIHFWAKG